MNITFTPEPTPKLTLSGKLLVALGFITGTPLQLSLRNRTLWVTTATDVATWFTLCAVSQQRQDLGADWVRDNGELVIGGDWLTESGITSAAQLTLTAAPGIIRVQRREEGGFRA